MDLEKKKNAFWNVIVTPVQTGKKSARNDIVAVDKKLDWVEARLLEPRRSGKPITIDGHTLDWSEISRVRITVSDDSSATVTQRMKSEDRSSSIAVVGGPSYKWRAAARADDVTDDLIDSPPGNRADSDSSPPDVDPRRVMVVHGRDSEARRALFDFLRAIGLDPGEWHSLVAETEKGSPYVGEVLDRAFDRATAVIVLFTPDDEARLRDAFLDEEDPSYEKELTPQARPNVLFEAGMAFGTHPDRVVLVELGKLRPFSDVFGRHVVRLNGTAGPLREIASRLKTAGCSVDESGNDWADPGRFPER